MKRVSVRLFPELHINEHRESDGHSWRSRNDHTGHSSAFQRREQTSYDEEESSKLQKAAMDLSPVPEALVTIRAARDKMKGKSEGKGELAVSFSGQGKGKWRKSNSTKYLQDKLAARKSKSTFHECGQRCHWAGDPQCSGNRDTNFTTWPDDQSFPDREDSRTIMTVERIEQSGVFSPCSNLREHSVCTNSVSHFRCSPVDAHIPVSLVVTGTVHPTRSADSQEFCRSVMENSEPSASKSDLGLGIIDTACLFCVAGSAWWANYKSLLEDFGLKHEIDETREAERYNFRDGGTLVSSIRVTAPIFVAATLSPSPHVWLTHLQNPHSSSPRRCFGDFVQQASSISTGYHSTHKFRLHPLLLNPSFHFVQPVVPHFLVPFWVEPRSDTISGQQFTDPPTVVRVHVLFALICPVTSTMVFIRCCCLIASFFRTTFLHAVACIS